MADASHVVMALDPGQGVDWWRAGGESTPKLAFSAWN